MSNTTAPVAIAKVTVKATGNVFYVYEVAGKTASYYEYVRNGQVVGCSCPARKHRKGKACKHMIAFQLVLSAARKAEQEIEAIVAQCEQEQAQEQEPIHNTSKKAVPAQTYKSTDLAERGSLNQSNLSTLTNTSRPLSAIEKSLPKVFMAR